MNAYLTAARIASLKKYLADCAAGVDFNAAFRAHQERMKRAL